ncbi:MAG: hypothetical protein AB7F19_01315 [Candidatus Babeliales bacterium]
MNRRVYELIVLFISIVFIGSLFGEPPAQERYLQANKLYEQGDIKKAYELYKSISTRNPELLINKGNAAYALGLFPEALVNWRRAQRFVTLRDYTMLQERVASVQQEHGGVFHETRVYAFLKRIDLYMRFIPFKIWQLVFFVVLALGLFLVTWYKRRNWIFIMAWSVLLLVVAALLMVRYTEQNRLMGFVLRDTAVFVNKNSQARVKAALQRGQEVEIRAIHDTWYLVTDGSVTGWLLGNDVQLV